jgi:cytidylate kinase
MNENVLLILLGKRGAGMTSIAKLFEKQNDYEHIEMSKFINEIKNKTESKDVLLRKYVENTHEKYGADYFIKKVWEKLRYSKSNIVITGIRHLPELRFIIKHFPDRQLVFIYIQVSVLKRMKRVIFREQRNSIIQFLIEEYYSIKWGNYRLRESSIIYKSDNNLITSFKGIENLLFKR